MPLDEVDGFRLVLPRVRVAVRSGFAVAIVGIVRGAAAVVGIDGGADSTTGTGVGAGSMVGAGGVKFVSAGAEATSGVGSGAGGSSATNALSPTEIVTLIPSLWDSSRDDTSRDDQPTMASTVPWIAQERMSALRGIPRG
jgi:hypothetical protein